jgi:hypothetical protein
MYIATMDFEGSGSLQYLLRPEHITAREIRIVMRDWTPYVALSNTMTLSAKIEITVPADLLEKEFEARRNLEAIRANIRSAGGLIGPDVIRSAEDALHRLRTRENESIESWAENLSKDISSQHD